MDNKKGFTLIEVLIATAIMVTVLGALVYGLSQSSNLIETMHNQGIALNAAQEKLEEIASSNLSNIKDYNKTSKNNFPVVGLTAPPGQVNPGQVTVTWIDGTPVNKSPKKDGAKAGTPDNLFDVEVKVTWQQRGARAISRTLTTTLVEK